MLHASILQPQQLEHWYGADVGATTPCWDTTELLDSDWESELTGYLHWHHGDDETDGEFLGADEALPEPNSQDGKKRGRAGPSDRVDSLVVPSTQRRRTNGDCQWPGKEDHHSAPGPASNLLGEGAPPQTHCSVLSLPFPDNDDDILSFAG